MTLAHAVLAFVEQAVLVYFLLLNTAAALLLVLAIRERMRHWHAADDEHLAGVLASPALPPVSIVVAVRGARAAMPRELESYLALEYPRHEVIVVLDGVPESMSAELDLYAVPPAVMVTVPTAPIRGYFRSRRFSKLSIIDKAFAGRADALNAAVNAARYPYVLTVDAGTKLEPDVLERMTRPFLLGKSTAVVGGPVRVAAEGKPAANEGSRWVAGVQSVESLRTLVLTRLGWNGLGGSVDMSGALTLLLRDHMLAASGYRASTGGEDSDLVLRVLRQLHEQQQPNGITLVPDVVAWTAAAPSARQLARQREWWHRGLIALLAGNRELAFNARYGKTGLLVLPYLLLGELLAPVIEAAGYLCVLAALAMGDWHFVVMFVVVGPVYVVLLSLWTLVLDRAPEPRVSRDGSTLGLSAWALAEPFGYRQLLWWARLRATWRYLRGKHSRTGAPRDVAVGRGNALSEGI